MKIAVPVTSTNQVDEHFGHCEFYSIYTVSEKNEITKIETIPSVPVSYTHLDVYKRQG